jgi:hypothetical protein
VPRKHLGVLGQSGGPSLLQNLCILYPAVLTWSENRSHRIRYAENQRDRVTNGNSPEAHTGKRVPVHNSSSGFPSTSLHSLLGQRNSRAAKRHVTVSQKGMGLLAGFEGIFFNGWQCGDSVCGEVLHDEERLEEGDRGGCAGTFTSLIAGGVETIFSGVEGVEISFSVVEGETDLPFLPDGAGTPFGQGVRGTRGLSAVFAETRTDRVLSCRLLGAFLGLVSALGVSAQGFERVRGSSQWVGSRELTQHTADARTFTNSTGTRRALESHHSTGRS